ncbi:MAG: hypothetical protein ACTHW7_05850 [Actinomycetaceae bacterium]
MRERWAASWMVARRLALSGDRRQRWRQISLVVCALLGTVGLLLAGSIIHAGVEASRHLEARTPDYTYDPADARMTAAWSGPVIPGFSQIDVIWLDPDEAHADDPDLVPPGLSHMPGPGEAVLSPGLVRAGFRAEDFGAVPSDAGAGPEDAISEEGLVSASEGLVYIRVTEDRELGYPRGFGIERFGPDTHGQPLTIAALDVPTTKTAVIGSIFLLVVPSSFLILGGARALPELLRDRARIWWNLGVSGRSIKRVVSIETAILAGTGAAIGALLWRVVIAGRRTFPLSDGVLLTGATRLPVWIVLPVVLAALGLAVVGVRSNPVPVRARPERMRARDQAWLWPLAVSFLVMFLAPSSSWLLPGWSSELQVIVLFAGAIGVLASMPAAIPVLSGMLAPVVGGQASPVRWLALRRVSVRTRSVARPATMVGALVFVAGASFALIFGTGTGNDFTHQRSDSANLYSVMWEDGQDGDEQALEARLREGGASMVEREIIVGQDLEAVRGPSQMGTDQVVRFESCEEARAFYRVEDGALNCDPADSRYAQYLGTFLVFPDSPPLDTEVQENRFLVSTPTEWGVTDVLEAATGLPGVSVDLVAGPPSTLFHPGVDWVTSGLVAASLLLLVALLRDLGDRVARSARDGSDLLRAGLTDQEAHATMTTAMMFPLLIAAPLGFAAAVTFALRGLALGLNEVNLGMIALAAVGVTVLAIAVVALALRLANRPDRRAGRTVGAGAGR